MEPPSRRGSVTFVGSGQIGSPTFTSTWNGSRAVASDASRLTRTPEYSSRSKEGCEAMKSGGGTRATEIAWGLECRSKRRV